MAADLKPHISNIDRSFKDSQIRTYKMAMQLGLHGLDFVVYNPDKNKFIVFESYRFDDGLKQEEFPLIFDRILNHHNWFGYPFGEVHLLYQNNFNTLVPLPLFNEKDKSLYLGYNQPFQENNRILFDILKNTGAANVFYLPNPVAEKVKDFWPHAKLHHTVSALIESLTIHYKNRITSNDLFLNVRNGLFDLVRFKGNKLFYSNTFSYKTKEDFIYFLLAAIEQLELNPQEVNLIIMGKIDKSTEEYEMIYQYIKNSRFIEQNDNFLYSYVLDNVVHHSNYVLYNVLQCEL